MIEDYKYIGSWIDNIEERDSMSEIDFITDIIRIKKQGSDGSDFDIKTACEIAGEVLGQDPMRIFLMVHVGSQDE